MPVAGAGAHPAHRQARVSPLLVRWAQRSARRGRRKPFNPLTQPPAPHLPTAGAIDAKSRQRSRTIGAALVRVRVVRHQASVPHHPHEFGEDLARRVEILIGQRLPNCRLGSTVAREPAAPVRRLCRRDP